MNNGQQTKQGTSMQQRLWLSNLIIVLAAYKMQHSIGQSKAPKILQSGDAYAFAKSWQSP